jgi:hypothetical protein
MSPDGRKIRILGWFLELVRRKRLDWGRPLGGMHGEDKLPPGESGLLPYQKFCLESKKEFGAKESKNAIAT